MDDKLMELFLQNETLASASQSTPEGCFSVYPTFLEYQRLAAKTDLSPDRAAGDVFSEREIALSAMGLAGGPAHASWLRMAPVTIYLPRLDLELELTPSAGRSWWTWRIGWHVLRRGRSAEV